MRAQFSGVGIKNPRLPSGPMGARAGGHVTRPDQSQTRASEHSAALCLELWRSELTAKWSNFNCWKSSRHANWGQHASSSSHLRSILCQFWWNCEQIILFSWQIWLQFSSVSMKSRQFLSLQLSTSSCGTNTEWHKNEEVNYLVKVFPWNPCFSFFPCNFDSEHVPLLYSVICINRSQNWATLTFNLRSGDCSPKTRNTTFRHQHQLSQIFVKYRH